MKVLIFTPDKNSPRSLEKGERDFDGAFKPESDRLGKLYPGAVVCRFDIDQPDRDRRQQVLDALAANGSGIDLVAFLCHGWRTGIQAGFDVGTGVIALASAIGSVAAAKCRIALYACATASGPNMGDTGFADELRDRTGLQVDAHSGVGHTTRFPGVIRFAAGLPGVGGDWLVTPDDPQLPGKTVRGSLYQRWYNRLHDSDDMLRFRYPLMRREEIIAELQSS